MTQSFRPVHSLTDLRQFGINYLTGEACAYGMRKLCDVNEDGVKLLSDFFGCPELNLAQNWNSMVGEKPAIGSVMLTLSCVQDLSQFAFFAHGALAVVRTADSVNGVFEGDMLKEYESFCLNNPAYTLVRNPATFSNAPHMGSRNVHAATGRLL